MSEPKNTSSLPDDLDHVSASESEDESIPCPKKRRLVYDSKTAHSYASEFHRKGAIVFPLTLNNGEKSDGKYPLTNDWQNTTVKKSMTYLDNPKYKDHNWGLLTGKKSRVYVIDCDLADEKKLSGVDFIDKVIKEKNIKIETLVVRTGSGGLHYYFLYDNLGECTFESNFQGLTVEGEKYGIDCRSTGGLIVLPGAMHYKSKNRYQIESGSIEHISKMPSELFDILHQAKFPSTTNSKIFKLIPTLQRSERILLPLLNNTINEEYKNIFQKLSAKRSDDRDCWIRVLLFLKTHGEHYKEVGRAFSQKSDKHVDEDFEKTWQTLNIREIKNPITISTFKLWLKEDQAEMYSSLTNMKLDRGDQGLADLFSTQMNGDLVLKVEKDRPKTIYRWDEKAALWIELSDITQLISITLENYVLDCIANTFEEKTLNELQKIKMYVLSDSGLMHINRRFQSMYEKTSPVEFNMIKHLLPLKDKKVIDIRTLEVRNRVKDDLFTVSLDLEFKEDKELWDPAISFFKELYNDDDIRTYVITMLGYGLTGEHNLKCAFFGIGDANNGKTAGKSMEFDSFPIKLEHFKMKVSFVKIPNRFI
jgi:hypothetical protein